MSVEEDEERHSEASSDSSSAYKGRRKRKPKLYEIDSSEDPNFEKRRRNAVNAYKNRLMQKQLIDKLRKEVKSLDHINKQACKALVKTKKHLDEMQERIDRLEKITASQTQQMKCKEKDHRKNRERMVLLSGHLELIAGSLDHDNPAKRLITNLLHRLSEDSSTSEISSSMTQHMGDSF